MGSCLAAVMAVACSGDSESGDGTTLPGPTPDPGSGLDCSERQPGEAPLRRLSKTEFGFTIEDLFGYPATIAGQLPDEQFGSDGYDNYADSANISQLRADALFDAAETVADASVQDLTALLPCESTQVDDECVDEFIANTGRHVYRRPLQAEELSILRAAYDKGDATMLATRVATALQVMLVSPQFLFRPERIDAQQSEGAAGVAALDGHEIATRLSYMLWSSTPDDILLDAAAAGELDTVAGIESQVRRMFDDPKARRGVTHFLRQWLDIAEFEETQFDPEYYPQYAEDPEAMQAAMIEQMDRFFARVVIDDEGSVAELLTSRTMDVNADLAAIYGVSHPGDNSWVSVELPEEERKGALTMSAWLTRFGFSRLPATFRRAKFIKERITCDTLPDPDPDADLSPVVLEDGVSNREALEARLSQSENCQKCHQSFGHFGYAFENFDSIGQFRTVEVNGAPIDTAGEILQSDDIDGEFDSWSDLLDRMASSKDVSDCMSRQVFRFAYARRAQDGDSCTVASITQEEFPAIVDVMVSVATSDGFRFRDSSEDGGEG